MGGALFRLMPPEPKLAVLSDFDGTITTVDTAVFILERYAVGDWRELDRQLRAGSISVEQCVERQLEMIGIGQERIIRELDEVIRPRDGFDALFGFCRSRDHPLEITSAGLDFYIRHFLARHGWDGIEVVAPRCYEAPEGLRFEFPSRAFTDTENFKDDRVRHYQHLGHEVVYIGDGTADLAAAKRADHAFAVRGSNLARLLAASGAEFRPIDDLSEVVGRLERLGAER